MNALRLLPAVVVRPAKIQNRVGAKLIFAKADLLGSRPRLKRVWADGGCSGRLVAWVESVCQWILEIVKRNDDVKRPKPPPKRWGVKRTFSRLSNRRRPCKHYKHRNETGKAMVPVAMIR